MGVGRSTTEAAGAAGTGSCRGPTGESGPESEPQAERRRRLQLEYRERWRSRILRGASVWGLESAGAAAATAAAGAEVTEGRQRE